MKVNKVNQIILSYRVNSGTPRKPEWSEWEWSWHAPLDNPLGVVSIIERFNLERKAFPNLEYKLDVGSIGLGGVISPLDPEWHQPSIANGF